MNNFEQNTKNIEKSYLKREMDTSDFIEKYMRERKEYHKYQFIKLMAG